MAVSLDDVGSRVSSLESNFGSTIKKATQFYNTGTDVPKDTIGNPTTLGGGQFRVDNSTSRGKQGYMPYTVNSGGYNGDPIYGSRFSSSGVNAHLAATHTHTGTSGRRLFIIATVSCVEVSVGNAYMTLQLRAKQTGTSGYGTWLMTSVADLNSNYSNTYSVGLQGSWVTTSNSTDIQIWMGSDNGNSSGYGYYGALRVFVFEA